MKTYMQILTAATATIALSACGATKQASIASLAGEWEIHTADGKALKGETTPFIGINTDNGTVYGSTGCNDLTGSIDKNSKPGTIDFSQLGSTRMMCADMTTERTVMDMLNSAKGYKVDGDKVILTDAKGKTVARLESRKGKMSHSDLQGEWKIASVDGMTSESAEVSPSIWFDTEEHLVHGCAGCNTFDGSYTTGGKQTLKFGDIAATMRLCADSTFEDKVLRAFDEVAAFGKLSNGNAALFSASGEMLIELTRQ